MFIAFSGLLVLFSIYIYDWYQDSAKMREDVAYKKMLSNIEKIKRFTVLNADIVVTQNNYEISDQMFAVLAKQKMINNSAIKKITKLSLDENNEIIKEVSIRRDNQNAFYYPVSIVEGINSKQTNRMNFSDFGTLHLYMGEYLPTQWSYSSDTYRKIIAEKYPFVYMEFEDAITLHRSFEYTAQGILSTVIITKLFKMDNGKVLFSIELMPNFMNQYIKNILGDDVQFFYIVDGSKKIFIQKSNILEAIDINHEDIYNDITKFNYAGTDYVVSYHKMARAGIVVVTPSSIYYAFDEPIDYSLMSLLLFVMVISSSLAIFYFRCFRKKVHRHVNTILSIQQKSSSGLGLDHDIAYIRDNLTTLNRYMPNNFRSFESNYLKENKVTRKEVCVMFIQLEQLKGSHALNLNKLYQNIIPCIIDTGGVIDKLMGNSISAIWLDNPDHVLAVNACKSALAIENLFKDSVVQVQIGINIGTCDVGSYGNEVRSDHTISGKPVNLTSRICKITKQYGTPILLSEYVFDCLDQVYPTRLVDAVIAPKTRKGFHLYELLPSCESEREAVTEFNYNSDFAHAFKLYQNKRWEEALIVFQKIEKYAPGNPIIQTFIRRIKTAPIPRNWQGYWQL